MSTRLTPSDFREILTATLPSPVLVKGNASGGLRPGTEPSPSNADSVAAAQDVAVLAKRLLLPTRYMKLEPPVPLSATNDDPVFKTRAAATILGLTADTLKKWRQRGAAVFTTGSDASADAGGGGMSDSDSYVHAFCTDCSSCSCLARTHGA